MFPQPKVLLVTEDGSETEDFQEFLRNHTALTCAQGLREVRTRLRQAKYDAVLCGRRGGSETWREVIEAAEQESPGVPSIVLSREANGAEWREALGAGAFDLITLPIPAHTLLGILLQAVASQQARTRWMQAEAAEEVSV